jgi:hypothetical protein
MNRTLSLAALVAVLFAPAAWGIPTFARRYDVSCEHCHVIPPKLNAFGEDFLARGYQHPDLTRRRTWPLAVWASGRAESRRLADGERETIDPFANRVELLSGGRPLPWLSYFAEWRVLSEETRSDGSLRDRSGRFEDLFATASLPGGLEATVGQLRQVAQVDVSRRLSLSESLVLSASLPGEGGGTARERSLSSFSPSGRSPAARLSWRGPLASGWELTVSGSLPVPGELSVPLSSEAEEEASNELELHAKGVVFESYVRRGVTSFGGHLFYDDGDRYLADLVAAGAHGPFFWAVVAGLDRSAGQDRSRGSLEGEFIPSDRWGVGLRIEDRSDDGAEVAALPYATWHFPWRRSRVTVTFEQRLQQDRNASLLEIGLLF